MTEVKTTEAKAALIKQMEKEFTAKLTAAIKMAQAAKTLYRAGYDYEAVMNAEDAALYAEQGYNRLLELYELKRRSLPNQEESEGGKTE